MNFLQQFLAAPRGQVRVLVVDAPPGPTAQVRTRLGNSIDQLKDEMRALDCVPEPMRDDAYVTRSLWVHSVVGDLLAIVALLLTIEKSPGALSRYLEHSAKLNQALASFASAVHNFRHDVPHRKEWSLRVGELLNTLKMIVYSACAFDPPAGETVELRVELAKSIEEFEHTLKQMEGIPKSERFKGFKDSLKVVKVELEEVALLMAELCAIEREPDAVRRLLAKEGDVKKALVKLEADVKLIPTNSADANSQEYVRLRIEQLHDYIDDAREESHNETFNHSAAVFTP